MISGTWKRRVGAFIPIGCLMLGLVPTAFGQGLVKGVEQGAREGNKAAGPVGGVLGGAIGGVVGVVGGVLGVGSPQAQQPQQSQPPAPTQAAKEPVPKAGRPAKPERIPAAKATKAAAAGVPAPVQLTAEQIVTNSDANITRIKTELKLTAEQEKHWGNFNSAMHYLGRNGADRLNLRIARARRDPPDDIVEQMRNEAQFLNDRSTDQRAVADAAEPLFASLDDKQKAVFIEEMVKLSRERGLD